MNKSEEAEKKLSRLKKRIVREKKARAEAERLLEEKSREIYQLNQKLHQDARLLEATVINAKDGIVITDADFNNDGPKIIYANKAFSHITGYDLDELIGQNPKMLQGVDTDRGVLDDLKESLSSGQSFQAELKNYRKNGIPYWLEISIVPVKNDEGKVTHFAAIERDVTQQKKTQKELKEKKEQAEAANVAKSMFLANMSHEIRTPMNAIMGMTEILNSSNLDKEQKENVEILYNSSRDLLFILNDILDISKIEAGEVKLEYVAFSIKKALEHSVELYSGMAKAKEVRIDWKISKETPENIVSDLGRVQQILKNLISNALKFTDKGKVEISIKKEKRSKDNKDVIYVEVKDTGIGISKENIKHIFKKFTQADASVTRKFGGTGLGLTITQKLVDLMNGEIGVESKEGKGSVFWFTLPLVETSKKDTIINMIPYKRGYNVNEKELSQLRILSVDDHPVNQLFIRKLLKKMGVEKFDQAEDGQQALHRLKEKDYDVILMDCQMPNMDGYQATKAIRERERGTNKHVPIIALTANAMAGDKEKCLKIGMDYYLSKPIRMRDMISIFSSITMAKTMRNLKSD